MVTKPKAKAEARVRRESDSGRVRYKEPIRGLYINKEMKARFERLRGRTINLNRLDPEGNAYVEAYKVPDKIITMARDALFEFFGTLEDIEGLDHDVIDDALTS